MLIRSWVECANSPETDFPLNNLPCGVFTYNNNAPRCGVAIGDQILDCALAAERSLFSDNLCGLFDRPSWNAIMEAGQAVWLQLRKELVSLLEEGSSHQATVSQCLVLQADATLSMPFEISEYTDFYAGRHHATNVGTMFRGAENALPPNWLHMPIGYNGRASSVYVSGTSFNRPWGQLKSPKHDLPALLPSRRFDFELEIGAVVGQRSNGPISVAQADQNIFGYVILNDWSARDIQAWEYQPLGPFQAKATATSISPWIVMKAALEPFRCSTPEREYELLDHLKDCGPMLYDIDLAIQLSPQAGGVTTISKTNYREMYYSSAQQLAHHASSGGPMNVGDLLGSGTISGPSKTSRGSLLELSWGGKEPIVLETGEKRTFLEDYDTLILSGAAHGDGYKIGFGECVGTVLPALEAPYKK